MDLGPPVARVLMMRFRDPPPPFHSSDVIQSPGSVWVSSPSFIPHSSLIHQPPCQRRSTTDARTASPSAWRLARAGQSFMHTPRVPALLQTR
ncbi:hypothetical protein GQ607_000551 [Colletotrichum asianum]|uniref:Uncharacterized protein n=1 Tax=Colletotrichum asianum TaxID=702518 RepID=A0A8H3WTV8_9PEZI|nr:hypothetical protein GQ607_000551 [Colletotrichum asianum]